MTVPAPVSASTPTTWRVALVALLATTAAIHLVMTPAHFEESAAMGMGFIAAGLLQLGLAALVVLHPRPALYLTVAVASIVLVSLYCVNVAVGLPWAAPGPAHEGATHDVSAAADGHEVATDAAHVEGDDDHHADDVGDEHGSEGSDEHAAVGDSTEPHGHSGIHLGLGEPVDAIGGTNLAVELASTGVAIALFRRRRA